MIALRAPRVGAATATVLLVFTACTDKGAQDEVSGVMATQEQVEAPDPYEHSPSRFGTVSLHAGFSPDPRVVGGTALGEVPADSMDRRCRGWISKVPDYLLDADTAFFQLHVLGRSRSDVVLVVRNPDGRILCNDNRKGTTDPMIRSDFPIGTTQIWVGVKEKGATAEYRLGFSEMMWRSSSIPLPDLD